MIKLSPDPKRTILKRARFIGADGSLKYKNDEIYTIEMYFPSIWAKIFGYGFEIDLVVLCEGHKNCPYTWRGFRKNWRI